MPFTTHQHQGRTGPVGINDPNPFSVEMAQGCLPLPRKIVLGPKIPLPLDQVNHVPAPISIEMFAGNFLPASQRYLRPYTLDTISNTAALFITVVSSFNPVWAVGASQLLSGGFGS